MSENFMSKTCPICNSPIHQEKIVCDNCFEIPSVKQDIYMTIGGQIEARLKAFYSNHRTIRIK